MTSCPYERGSNIRSCNNVCVVDDIKHCLSESVKVKNMHSQKFKVISGEGQKLPVKELPCAFYSKRHTPSEVESLLVHPAVCQSIRTFKANAKHNSDRLYAEVVENKNNNVRNVTKYSKTQVFWKSNPNKSIEKKVHTGKTPVIFNEVIESDNKTNNNGTKAFGALISESDTHKNGQSGTCGPSVGEVANCDNHGESDNETHSGDTTSNNGQFVDIEGKQKLLFNIRGSEYDKFINSIIFHDQSRGVMPNQSDAYELWCQQSKVTFGFVPLSDPIMPATSKVSNKVVADPIELHEEVKKQKLPNYLGACIPVESQLNVQAWESLLEGYWDKQLLECIKFGFPLGFNRTCPLRHDVQNHKSAMEFPEHVAKYIEEEQHFGAIIGPFDTAPIANLHYSPFMTRHKPNSENRRVILDLSWPRGESVNAGTEKKWLHGQ